MVGCFVTILLLSKKHDLSMPVKKTIEPVFYSYIAIP
jgi:hypothetical protein